MEQEEVLVVIVLCLRRPVIGAGKDYIIVEVSKLLVHQATPLFRFRQPGHPKAKNVGPF